MCEGDGLGCVAGLARAFIRFPVGVLRVAAEPGGLPVTPAFGLHVLMFHVAAGVLVLDEALDPV